MGVHRRMTVNKVDSLDTKENFVLLREFYC